MTTRRERRQQFLPYCLPLIGQEEIDEVVDSLRSGWITTGPKVKRFEQEFAEYTGSRHAIAVNSCTAGLHLSLAALNIGLGDEIIVPSLTFCSTANVVVHLGAKPVIVDVGEDFQIDPAAVERAITSRTRAIVPVHYGGQACDLDSILAMGKDRNIPVIEDAAHAAGTVYKGRKIGTHGLTTSFSFYATKNLATGEGGMITCQDDDLAARLRLLSLHGMSRDAWKRYTQAGNWYYEVVESGYKVNMTDIQAALGIHQLKKLNAFNHRRAVIAARYDEALRDLPGVRTPAARPDCNHTYHLYPLRLIEGEAKISRDAFIDGLRDRNIGASVHFIPLHRHPAFTRSFGYSAANCPVAERIFTGLVSLPLYPKMSDDDVEDVVESVQILLT